MTGGALVLVVDDDADLRAIVRAVLEDAGYQVSEAADGGEALARLGKGQVPDLILLDLMMPGFDGWAFRERQVADPHLGQIPVVAFSGDGRVGQKASSLHLDLFLRKPIRLEDLLATVAKAVRPAGGPGS